MATKVLGEPSLAKIRPIAGLRPMRNGLGYLWKRSNRSSISWAMCVVTWLMERCPKRCDCNLEEVSLQRQCVDIGTSCTTDLLGRVTSSVENMNRRLPQGESESPLIFSMVMDTLLRKQGSNWRLRKLSWTVDDCILAICYADDVVLVRGSSRTDGEDVNIQVNGQWVTWEESLNLVVRSTAQPNKCHTTWKSVLQDTWVPSKQRVAPVLTTVRQAFLWSSSVWVRTETRLQIGLREWQ